MSEVNRNIRKGIRSCQAQPSAKVTHPEVVHSEKDNRMKVRVGLSLIRILGEVTNLLGLFSVDRNELESWKKLDEKARWDRFRPYKVRNRLEALKAPCVIDRDRYALLSSISVHANPDFMPNSQNDQGRAVLAPRFEIVGLMICVNELSRCIALISVTATSLIDVPRTIEKRTRSAGRTLAKNVGSIDVTVKGRPWLTLQ